MMLSNDAAAPVDRPNLSKDYLAGSAPEDWMPLRPDDFYKEANIDLRLKSEVGAIDAKARQVKLAGGESIPYDRLLLATGAEPVRAADPGRRSAACPYPALARRQPRDHRRRQGRAPCDRDRRQLHRP